MSYQPHFNALKSQGQLSPLSSRVTFYSRRCCSSIRNQSSLPFVTSQLSRDVESTPYIFEPLNLNPKPLTRVIFKFLLVYSSVYFIIIDTIYVIIEEVLLKHKNCNNLYIDWVFEIIIIDISEAIVDAKYFKWGIYFNFY